MRTGILILVTLGVLAIAIGGYLYFRGASPSPDISNVNSTVIAGNANGSAVATPPITKGDIAVNASVTYRDLQMTVETALKAEAFRRKQAPPESVFIVLFLKPFSTTPATDPLEWSSREIRLKSGATLVAPTEVSLPSRSDVAGGYLWFTVPNDTKNFSLVFGSGTVAQALSLGF